MTQNFMIKEGKRNIAVYCFLCLFIFLFVKAPPQSLLALLLVPIMFISNIIALANLIMLFRWTVSYAVLLDIEKQELILNHAPFFRKKRISLKNIKEIDTLNGTIILFASTPLSKWQKMVCKTPKSEDYTIRFQTIEACERRELLKLLNHDL